MIITYCIKTEKFLDSALASATLDSMSDSRKERYLKIKPAHSKAECLAGSYLLNHALKEFDLTEKAITIDIHSNGKPFIKELPDFFYNISHSGEYAVLAAGNSEVGIDIQKVSTTHNFNIAKRFFTESEYHYLKSLDHEKSISEFFRLWSIKEAYLKFTGEGLSGDLSSFSVTFCNNIPVIDIASNINIREFFTIPGYYISSVSACRLNNQFYFI